MKWNVSEDTLSIRSSQSKSFHRLTKRNILSTIAGIFDPLGLISPTLVDLKCMIQKLLKLGIEWDDEIPTDLKISANKSIQDLRQ